MIAHFMPNKMYKTLFLHTYIKELRKSINKVLCTNNNSCITQMGLCRVTIINDGIKYRCNFFVVSGYGPELLGIPHGEQRRRQINKQPKQDKSKPNNSIRNNLHTYNKIKQEIDYSIAHPST